ncbi:MAG: bestrophin family protein [Cytophagales bacterium]
MIKYDNKNWFSLLLKTWKSAPSGMFWSMVTIGFLTFLFCVAEFEFDIIKIKFPSNVISALSLVVGMLLVFRINSAYDRWWEGRKLLGQLMNTSRFLAMKFSHYFENESPEIKQRNESLIMAYAVSVAEHLTKVGFEKSTAKLPDDLIKDYIQSFHKPMFILNRISKDLIEWNKNKIINEAQLLVLEKNLSVLTDIIGACERIKNTPIPFAFALHLKRIILLFSIVLPFTLIDDLGYMSVPVVMIIFYILVGIELISEEVEDPFGLDDNDLPMFETAQNIQNNIDNLL